MTDDKNPNEPWGLNDEELDQMAGGKVYTWDNSYETWMEDSYMDLPNFVAWKLHLREWEPDPIRKARRAWYDNGHPIDGYAHYDDQTGATWVDKSRFV